MKQYFEGLYFKHRANGRTLALIPGRSEEGAFIQIITDSASFFVPYPLSAYQNLKGKFLRVGESEFSRNGVHVNIQTLQVLLTGELAYRGITPPHGDVMGPFRFLPMECRHSVLSVRHRVEGTLLLNGETLDFSGGMGYIEGDSGRSFPERYAWAHCDDFSVNASIMASVARIPFCGMRFTGVIAIVWLDGREYRLATYHGARAIEFEPGTIAITQGQYRLEIHAPGEDGKPLLAPVQGKMRRTVHESAACRAHFIFTVSGSTLLDEWSDGASCEWAGFAAPCEM